MFTSIFWGDLCKKVSQPTMAVTHAVTQYVAMTKHTAATTKFLSSWRKNGQSAGFKVIHSKINMFHGPFLLLDTLPPSKLGRPTTSNFSTGISFPPKDLVAPAIPVQTGKCESGTAPDRSHFCPAMGISQDSNSMFLQKDWFWGDFHPFGRYKFNPVLSCESRKARLDSCHSQPHWAQDKTRFKSSLGTCLGWFFPQNLAICFTSQQKRIIHIFVYFC